MTSIRLDTLHRLAEVVLNYSAHVHTQKYHCLYLFVRNRHAISKLGLQHLETFRCRRELRNGRRCQRKQGNDRRGSHFTTSGYSTCYGHERILKLKDPRGRGVPAVRTWLAVLGSMVDRAWKDVAKLDAEGRASAKSIMEDVES